ncbi:nonsense-mediated mRNA decay factor SMG9-like [Mercenaria mercenaria]|uniref:nonsense-mediated mRNA decay factor SMG9-like n=1 Tax=Mercenaria mercenaria TaxID=6596 RepID=UPI00234E5456|nr:nonsense-mediated mRNA decay factor SMG9-like [Mercenaria mercenaria]
MADSSERDRGRGGPRRRRPRGGGPPVRKERDYDGDTSSSQPTSRPIILAKHPENESSQVSSSGRGSTSTSPTPSNRQSEKPVTVLKPRGEDPRRTLSSSVSLPSIPVSTVQGETPPQQTFLQRTIEGTSRLSGPTEMSHCTKLIDEHHQWCETAFDSLLEQTDFLVVGVIGLQGTGKSTILSLLAGNTEIDAHRNYVFPPQSRAIREECGHMTNGIDIFVTSQRVIFLDCQPLLSASVLDQLIHNEKKIPPEYTTAENFAEIQSLQQVTLLLTVCNVVMVVQDWFTDLSVLHFLQTAEMLKPSTPSSSGHDSNSAPEDHPDYYPHIVFVQNKSGREDFSVENFTAMQKSLSTIFQTSKLKMKGDVNMTTGRQTFGLNPAFVKSDLNLFVLPCMDGRKDAEDTVLTMLPEYRGYPSFQTLINSLRGQILAMPREAITHTTLTEKNWFHYAARIWDSIKKSQLIAEYNRLLP